MVMARYNFLQVFGIAVSADSAVLSEVWRIASEPKSEFFYGLSEGFDALDAILSSIINRVCVSGND